MAPKSRRYISIRAFCRSRVPAVGVYLVFPACIAARAASLMFCGVSKSGSPAPRSTTSTPAARIASAACIAASVDDAFMRATFSETWNCELILVADILGNISIISWIGFSDGPTDDPRRHTKGNLAPNPLSHTLFDQWRHETFDRPTELKHFLHQTRADIRILLSGHHENRFQTRL